MSRTQAERTTALETEVVMMRKQLDSVENKLDDLLALKNKGAGIFWLASLLFGTGIVGTCTMFITWLRG